MLHAWNSGVCDSGAWCRASATILCASEKSSRRRFSILMTCSDRLARVGGSTGTSQTGAPTTTIHMKRSAARVCCLHLVLPCPTHPCAHLSSRHVSRDVAFNAPAVPHPLPDLGLGPGSESRSLNGESQQDGMMQQRPALYACREQQQLVPWRPPRHLRRHVRPPPPFRAHIALPLKPCKRAGLLVRERAAGAGRCLPASC